MRWIWCPCTFLYLASTLLLWWLCIFSESIKYTQLTQMFASLELFNVLDLNITIILGLQRSKEHFVWWANVRRWQTGPKCTCEWCLAGTFILLKLHVVFFSVTTHETTNWHRCSHDLNEYIKWKGRNFYGPVFTVTSPKAVAETRGSCCVTAGSKIVLRMRSLRMQTPPL